jgi:hypothetical protein
MIFGKYIFEINIAQIIIQPVYELQHFMHDFILGSGRSISIYRIG